MTSRCDKRTLRLQKTAQAFWESRWLLRAQENMHMHMGMHISIIMLLLTKRFMLLSPFLCFLMWA